MGKWLESVEGEGKKGNCWFTKGKHVIGKMPIQRDEKEKWIGKYIFNVSFHHVWFSLSLVEFRNM